MKCTLTNTHRLGHVPGRARVDGAIGQAWHGRLGRCAAANRQTPWSFVTRQANSTGASLAAYAFDGILAVPTMWTKCSARHLAPRST